MPPRMERNYGAIPDWAKTGEISVRNYPCRAEAHCAAQSSVRKGEHPVVTLETPEGQAWLEYFRWLGPGLWVADAFADKQVINLTVPEPHPEWFDSRFVRKNSDVALNHR